MEVVQVTEDADRDCTTDQGKRPRVRIVEVPAGERPATVTFIPKLTPEAHKRARASRRKERPPEG